MTNPVMRALVSARLQQLNFGERAIAEEVNATLGPAPKDTHRPARFINWCDQGGFIWRPATPSVIAKFVMEITQIGNIIEDLRSLSLAHTTQGLPDPCGAWQVVAAISRLTRTHHLPRSWLREYQLLWDALPEDIKQYVSLREEQRDKAVQRAQREAADVKKQLAQIQKGTEANGTIKEQPAENHAA